MIGHYSLFYFQALLYFYQSFGDCNESTDYKWLLSLLFFFIPGDFFTPAIESEWHEISLIHQDPTRYSSLFNAVIWMVSILPLIFSSSNFSKLLRIVLNVQTATGITVILMFHSLFFFIWFSGEVQVIVQLIAFRGRLELVNTLESKFPFFLLIN